MEKSLTVLIGTLYCLSLIMLCFVLCCQVDKGTAGLNGTDGETTTQGKPSMMVHGC